MYSSYFKINEKLINSFKYYLNIQDTTETPLQSPPTREYPPTITEEAPSSASSAKSAPSEDAAPQSNESLHCLSLDELNKALREAKILKCVSTFS